MKSNAPTDIPPAYTDAVEQKLSQLLAAADSSEQRMQTLGVITGNKMIDQFQPWYFGVAFAFVFSYCIGMPDVYHFAETARHRRPLAST